MNIELKEKIKKIFIEKLPNTLLMEDINVAFPDVSDDDLKSFLDELVKEGFLEPKQYPYNRQGYMVGGDLSKYPISFYTQVGSVKIPRMLDRDVGRAENINSITIGLAKAFEQKISDMKKTFGEEIKKYWASLATIFGLFIAIFSMVNLAVKPLYFSEQLGLSPKQQFFQTMYNLGPLAGVMILFIVALWLILRR